MCFTKKKVSKSLKKKSTSSKRQNFFRFFSFQHCAKWNLRTDKFWEVVFSFQNFRNKKKKTNSFFFLLVSISAGAIYKQKKMSRKKYMLMKTLFAWDEKAFSFSANVRGFLPLATIQWASPVKSNFFCYKMHRKLRVFVKVHEQIMVGKKIHLKQVKWWQTSYLQNNSK